jgi:hypothetical protein
MNYRDDYFRQNPLTSNEKHYHSTLVPSAVQAFIALWTVTTILILLVWMRRLR